MKASRIDANQKGMKAMFDACLENMEANRGALQSVAVHQEVPKEDGTVETFRALRRWHRVPPKVEENDPGRWWAPEEVRRRPQPDDVPCVSGTAQGTWSSGTRQRQGCAKNPGRTDVRDRTSGECGRHQWNKEPRLQGAAMFLKREDIRRDQQEAVLQEIVKRIAGSSIRFREMRDWTLWMGRCLPKLENRLHTEWKPEM
jgi:hypothetical protein